MGTGKTTVGKIVSKKMNMDFVDIDKEIENRHNMSISSIFQIYGEKYFRILEKKVAQQYSEYENIVISTGGGIVLDTDNIRELSKKGLIICLKADIEAIYRNVSGNKKRPLLTGHDAVRRIRALMEQREGLYNQADYTIDVSNISIDVVAEMVVRYATEAGI